MITKVMVYITQELVSYLEIVRKERDDESRSHTARVLIKEAFGAEDSSRRLSISRIILPNRDKIGDLHER